MYMDSQVLEGGKKMKVAVIRRYHNVPRTRWNLILRFVGSASLAIGALALSACGNSAASIAGKWDCGGNEYTFAASGWSSEGTPSHDLPYKINGDYIYMQTLANQSIPML